MRLQCDEGLAHHVWTIEELVGLLGDCATVRGLVA